MKQLFAVIRTRGLAWDHTIPAEEQPRWKEHAAFMNGLETEGFILLAGPLEGTSDILLIARATDDAQVRSRLAADPWGIDLLLLERVRLWSLRLGALDAVGGSLTK